MKSLVHLLLVYDNKPCHLFNERIKLSSLTRDKHIIKMDAVH